MDSETSIYYTVRFNDPVNGRDYWRLSEKGVFQNFEEAKAYLELRKDTYYKEWRIEKVVKTVVSP